MNCKKTILPMSVFVIGILAAVGAAGVGTDELTDITNMSLLEDDIIGGGLLNEETIEKAARQGIRSVIDLRRPTQQTAAEEIMVQNRTMRYFNIPVTSQTLSRAQADLLADVIDNPANRPAIVHDVSGNHVGAIWALYLKYHRGMDEHAALEEGIKKGLQNRQLQKITKKLLEKNE